MSDFDFFKKESENDTDFLTESIYEVKYNYFNKKCKQIFSDIFLKMDNKKGKMITKKVNVIYDIIFYYEI